MDYNNYSSDDIASPFKINNRAMYLVGEDLPSGLYKVLSGNNREKGFIEVYKKPVISRSNRMIDEEFYEQLYVELKEGQFIILTNSMLKAVKHD